MKVQTLSADLRRGLRPRGFTGEIVEPGHREYEAARRVWNGSIDRRPAAVLRCHDAEDVAAAVAAAVELGLQLAVRGGGHSVGGLSTVDDGIVIDLSGMRRVTVDAGARRAFVAGGALLGDLDRATQEHGLAVPAGQVSHTGVAGLTLGGGVGYLTRAHGLTIDSLVAAEVVTAGGETVTASAHEHADLFWALRGGGGNFGVVTRFEFALHEVGPLVYAGPLVYPLERAAEVMRASRAVMAGAPEELSIHEILLTVPEHPPFPEHLQGKRAVLLAPVHVGSKEQARADLEPLRELGPAFDLVGPMPYVALQSMIDDEHPPRAGALLEVALAARLRRRPHRRPGRALRARLLAAVPRHHGAHGRRDRARPGGGHGVRPPRGREPAVDHRPLGRPVGRRRAASRVGQRRARVHAAVQHRRRVRERARRGGPRGGAGRLRRGDVRAPAARQAALGPRHRLPVEPNIPPA